MSLRDGRVVSNFICQALRGEDITIYGDGSQTRSFCYFDDLIEGFLRMMDMPREAHPTEFWRLPLNLGNPTELTILELAEMVISLVGGRSKLIFTALPSDDPSRRRPDISRTTRALDGWTPRVNLEDGLRETVGYFKALRIV
jgi:UDP-glucuronate decarboxylase